jgi:hypothetical protein
MLEHVAGEALEHELETRRGIGGRVGVQQRARGDLRKDRGQQCALIGEVTVGSCAGDGGAVGGLLDRWAHALGEQCARGIEQGGARTRLLVRPAG